jgi:hypothetical protein
LGEFGEGLTTPPRKKHYFKANSISMRDIVTIDEEDEKEAGEDGGGEEGGG